MQYFGGKAKTAKYIVPFLENVRKENQVFIEPFVGGANIISKMTGERYAFDSNKYLIEMYKQVQKGYELPDTISEEEYIRVRENKDDDMCLTSFVGFGCSYSGRFFGGYARSNVKRNYCLNAKNSLLKKMQTLSDVTFDCKDYRDLEFKNCLIYCDPPYANTTIFMGMPSFDTEEFWEVMRKWSIDNDVYISEYEAPTDFECVLEMNTNTDVRDKTGKKCPRVEKLFKYIKR